jgi:hypothetical protein
VHRQNVPVSFTGPVVLLFIVVLVILIAVRHGSDLIEPHPALSLDLNEWFKKMDHHRSPGWAIGWASRIRLTPFRLYVQFSRLEKPLTEWPRRGRGDGST